MQPRRNNITDIPERPAPSSPLRPLPTRDIWAEYSAWSIQGDASGFALSMQEGIALVKAELYTFDDLRGLKVGDLTPLGIRAGTVTRIIRGYLVFKKEMKTVAAMQQMSQGEGL